MKTKKPLRVLFAASEATPLAKVGGLGDVIGALPKALAVQGVDVRVVLPKYRQIDPKKYPMQKTPIRFSVYFDGVEHVVRVFTARLPGSKVIVYLLDHPHYEGVGDVYYQTVLEQHAQEEYLVERFVFFSRAVAAFLDASPWKPDVLHCHDFHTAPAIFFADQSRLRPATILTLHNLISQATLTRKHFSDLVGPDIKLPQLPSINLLGIGIAAADWVTAVSPTYAKEVLTPALGEGVDMLLRKKGGCLSGIVNGIDVKTFNPATDTALATRYNIKTVVQKAKNTVWLKERFRLVGTGPCYGMVARITEQKGVHLVASLIPRLVREQDANIVVLGSGDQHLEQELTKSARAFKKNCSVTIKFDAALAQQIYAGADIFLMPSRFEPCGLGQLIAMRYGSVPIVHDTGGLHDTVREEKDGTGFVFRDFSQLAFWQACQRAKKAYTNIRGWRSLQRRDMRQDFSWSRSAVAYRQLYIRIRKNNVAAK